MKNLLLLLLTLISGELCAQTTFSDSLKQVLLEHPDSVKLVILLEVYHKNSSQNYDRARVAGNLALPLMESGNSPERLGDFLLELGQTEYTYGNHELALQRYMESARIFKELKLPAKEASIYNEIAVLHRKNKNLVKSKEYINNAFALFKQVYDTNGMATTLCNLGITNEIENKPDIALNYYREALTLYTAFRCDLCISYCLDYMAGAFKIQHRFDSALIYETQSLALRRKLDNRYAIAQSLMMMGEIYYEQGKFEKATAFFVESATLSHKINFKDYERVAYDFLAKSSEKTGNFKDAYRYHLLFTQISDSLFNETRSRQINELQVRYETEKQESEILSLQQKQQTKNFILVAVIVFSLMTVAGGGILYSRKQLKNRLAYERGMKETEEGERLRIAKDIHDDLGSGISRISFLSQEMYQHSQTPEMRKNASAVLDISTHLIDNMRDLVWELNTDNTTLDNLIARIREYVTDYMEDVPVQVVASYPDAIDTRPLQKVMYRNIFMVIKEALNNIVRHAKASHLYITVTVSGEELHIVIRDDGVGFDQKAERRGNGLLNMKSRIADNGGLLEIGSNGDGTTVRLQVNVSG